MFDFIEKMNFFEDKINAVLNNDVEHSLSTVFLDLVSNVCNHNCIFCDGKFYNIKPKIFDKKRLDIMSGELEQLGVNSVLIIGEKGDSLLNPNFPFFVNKLNSAGIHLGIYTNGSIFNKRIFKALSNFDFVRVSLDAGCASTHKIIHGYRGRNDFAKACNFIQKVSDLKVPDVGASFVVLKENIREIYKAAKIVKSIGASYFEIKPAILADYNFDWSCFDGLHDILVQELKKCETLSDKKFKIILNNQLQRFIEGKTNVSNMTRLDEPVSCQTCKLRMVVSPSGCYLCTPHHSKKEYNIGDPMKQSLLKIWNGPLHKNKMKKLCAYRCAYHDQNKILLKLKKKPFKSNTNSNVKNNNQKYFL